MQSSPSRPAELARLTALPFAHRGLHGSGIVENSRAAFEAAIAAGHGIELDVQGAAGGSAFVFHDAELDRLTDSRGPVAALDSEELKRVRLKGTDEPIPEFEEILDLIAGRVPLLVEIKTRRREWRELCSSVACALSDYAGAAAVMSFDPRVGVWFSRRYPNILRGLVVSQKGNRGFRGRFERSFAVRRARPDFLACDISDLPSRFAAQARERGLPILTWTCRGHADRARAAGHADQIIYENPQ